MKNDQIPTPKRYVIKMLDYIKYKNNVMGKRVLENSCGCGNILLEIVKRYIDDSRKRGICDEKIIKGIEQDIIAFEIDQEKIELCIQRLDKLAEENGLSKINWNISNADFLKQPEGKYDYIIGNPPYITYHDLDQEDREFLRKNFTSCEVGRFDYCYAFIEAGIRALNKDGSLIYLIPYSIVKNKFADKLREYIVPYIVSIYDYAGVKIFPDALTSSLIILMENKKNKQYIYYKKIKKRKRKILRNELQGKWSFTYSDTNNKQRFGDFFEVCNSIATLCNRAYILEEYSLRGNYYYVNGRKIEKQIVYPAISMKSYNKKKKNNDINDILILFPYKVIDKHLEHYSQKEFEEKYPMATKYLKLYKDELKKRKKDKNSLWFEYGRNQALKNIFGEKLVLPMVFTNQVSVVKAGSNVIPYAGYFIKCKNESKMTLDKAKDILESKEFYEYVKVYGTPTTPSSYRISVNDIKEYMF